jgi:hypothetical protein
MEQQVFLQALLNNIEKYPEGHENKTWFTKLIQNSLAGNTEHETEIDLLYNATVIENILATLLAVDIKTIVKVRMVSKIINTMWAENDWNINLLHSYILEEKP